MTRRFIACLVISHFLLFSRTAVSQTMTGTAAGTSESNFITFTFNSPCEECATQTNESGRYVVEIPSASNAALGKSQSLRDLNLQVTLKNDRVVYTFPFSPGTSPRAVWRKGATVLQIFFVPVGENLTAAVSDTGFKNALMTTNPAPAVLTNGSRDDSAITSGPALGNGSSVVTPAAPSAPAQGLQTSSQPIENQPGSTAFTSVDMSVPASPAFTVLGVTPETVIRPTSPRAFATSLLNGVDPNGNFQSGLAMDFAPYLLIAGDDLTLFKYRHSPMIRVLSRTQFSFATTKGASEDDKSLKLALGLNIALWDRGDPRMDQELIDCLSTIKTPPPPTQLECELPDHPTADDIKAFEKCQANIAAANQLRAQQVQEANEFNNSVSTRCREDAQKKNWNRSSWTIGGAPSWISKNGQTKDLLWNGGGFWTSFAYGFEGVPGLDKKSQLILHARYRNREQVPDPNVSGAFLSQDSLFFGTRFRTGSPTFNGSFEYTFLRSRVTGLKYDNSSRLSLLFERRIAGDTWFNLSLGGETGRQDGRNNGFVLTSFKWAFSDRKNVPVQPVQ